MTCVAKTKRGTRCKNKIKKSGAFVKGRSNASTFCWLHSRDNQQCHEIAKSTKKRCKNRTKKTPYCMRHLKSVHHFTIDESRIPGAGLGLFTTQNITMRRANRKAMSKPKPVEITKYGGRITSVKPRSDYVVEIKDGEWMDGTDPNSSIGRFANVCRPPHVNKICKNNATITVGTLRKGPNAGDKSVKLIATKNIDVKKNPEIYLAYSSAFKIPNK